LWMLEKLRADAYNLAVHMSVTRVQLVDHMAWNA